MCVNLPINKRDEEEKRQNKKQQKRTKNYSKEWRKMKWSLKMKENETTKVLLCRFCLDAALNARLWQLLEMAIKL